MVIPYVFFFFFVVGLAKRSVRSVRKIEVDIKIVDNL